ncbi:hypothetical protein [Achromobacter ruhlandii]|uniref:Uncharacterized protein n=1 Tax=Achromobacter ruhlandii TaxID=72557 RepID=A0A2M9GV21_9BURK|nr:hypothetical protein [Achromobacter ruhlandii]PJM68410.1 hypothetical protein CV751_19475 [Achromobacter ruhlandii]CAB3905882.1 hypothetical protein LMG3328_04539 [Achromobacter ruhlandii]
MDDYRVTTDVSFIKRVLEVGDRDVNKYLSRGWVLLAVLKKIRDDSYRDEFASFVVGHADPAAT